MLNSNFNRFITLSIFALGLLFLPSCEKERGSGDLVTETRSRTDFSKIDMCVPGEVEVTVGQDFFVEVTCEESIIDYLDTKVEDGTLEIKFDRWVTDVDDLLIKVTAPSWDGFEVSGSGAVHVFDAISGNVLDIEVSGSGSVVADDVDFAQSNLELSGSGNITLIGVGDDLDVEVSGSGTVACLEYPVLTSDTEMSGSGCIRVNVEQSLNAEVSGSGCVEYMGDPQVTSEISGSGKVRKL